MRKSSVTQKGPGDEPGSFFFTGLWSDARKEATMSNVSWSDLMQFVIMICAVVTVVQNSTKKK